MRKSLYILTFALILTMASSVAMAADAAPGATKASGVVNINNADASQLALLPGVGEKAAQRIIEYRTQHGPFRKTSELMQVKGFGAKSFERLSGYLTVEGKTTLASKVRSPRAKKPANPAS
jgi:competence protein ComEA